MSLSHQFNQRLSYPKLGKAHKQTGFKVLVKIIACFMVDLGR